MKYDDLLCRVGEFGKFQKLQYFLICLISITSALHSMNMVFVGPVPGHHCKSPTSVIPQPWSNLTKEQQYDLTYPLDDNVDDGYSQCTIYNMSEVNWETGGYENWLEINRTTVSECPNGMWYSDEHYDSTIVTEWDLVCNKNWQKSLGSSIFFAGRFLGALLGGIFSDKFGRMPVFLVSVLLQVVIGCSASFAPNLVVFYVLYFMQGIVQVAVYLSSYVLGAELVGPSYRKLPGYVNNYLYSFGQMLLAFIAYFIRDWRYIELAISLPPLLFLSYYWLVPESARWLLSVGRRDKAMTIIKKMAKVNEYELDEKTLQELESDPVPEKGYSIVDVMKRWSLAKIALNIWFNWFANALVYYGLNLNTSKLAGNPYLNFFIAAAIEIPSLTLGLLLIDRVGRRLLFFSLMMLGGCACLATAFVPEDMAWLATTLSMVGKFAITASYSTIYLMAAEVFPTVVRNVGMGAASMSARIGGMLAPQIVLLGDYVAPLPLIVFGGIALVGGWVGLLLPEPTGKPLPQGLDDMAFGGERTPSTEDDAGKKPEEVALTDKELNV